MDSSEGTVTAGSSKEQTGSSAHADPDAGAQHRASSTAERASVNEDEIQPAGSVGLNVTGNNDMASDAHGSRQATIEQGHQPSPYDHDEQRSNTNANSESTDDSLPLARRQYRFINRARSESQNNAMRTKWINESTTVDVTSLSQLICCKRLECFRVSNKAFLKARMTMVRKAPNHQRRMILQSMLTSHGYFTFDGRQVCASFLEQAFKFSRYLQSSVKETRCGRVVQAPNEAISDNSRTSVARDSIITFLRRIADSSGDRMPDRAEIHVPFQRREDLFELFQRDYRQIYPGTPPLKPFFYRVWRESCSEVKVRKVSRFAKCSECESLAAAIRDAVKAGDSTAELLRRKKHHVDRMMEERRAYYSKRDAAKLRPDESISIIIDGADQSSFGLPHFTVMTKDVTGHALKVKLVGLLEHGVMNRLHLYTLTEEHETGSNHIVESLHRFLNARQSRSPLPPELFIQLDNCSRENKNRYLFGYVECLVAWGAFESVEVGFLPVGHTHEDIDQAFSRTSARLRDNNAVTLEDLHDQLKLVFNDQTQVSYLQLVANWKGLCVAEKCISNVPPFINRQYFRFTRAGEKKEDVYPTACFVKSKSSDEWVKLMPHNDGPKGFVRFPPDLRATPDTRTKLLTGKDDVVRRIQSEDARINSLTKRRALDELVDYVFKQREDCFHWDLSRTVEVSNKGKRQRSRSETNSPGQQGTGVLPASVDEIVRNEYSYEVGCFVAVKPEQGNDTDTDSTSFWIGRVQRRFKNKDGVIALLLVRWYEPKDNNNLFTSKYIPCFLPNKADVEWKDKISTDAVMLKFPSMTKKGILPALVQRRLRSTLSP